MTFSELVEERQTFFNDSWDYNTNATLSALLIHGMLDVFFETAHAKSMVSRRAWRRLLRRSRHGTAVERERFSSLKIFLAFSSTLSSSPRRGRNALTLAVAPPVPDQVSSALAMPLNRGVLRLTAGARQFLLQREYGDAVCNYGSGAFLRAMPPDEAVTFLTSRGNALMRAVRVAPSLLPALIRDGAALHKVLCFLFFRTRC